MMISKHEISEQNKSEMGRRRFIKAMACIPLVVAGIPKTASSAVFQPKHLSFYNTHTGEKIALTYFEQGRYLADALEEVNYVLRDHRTGDVHEIDTSLLDQLYDLRKKLGVSKPIQIISGYRSPATNAMLSRNSSGVAQKSLHMLGKAIDIRIEGVDSKVVRNAAISMRKGGVGYYQSSNFVHVDTGRVRYW
ncbi:MAG: YcbK family protein [Gammaproteobacteria bacterium]